MHSTEIRDATVDDALAIARIHVESWRAAYRGLMPDDVLDNLSMERREQGWRLRLSESADAAVLVAEQEGRVVGFSSVGPPEDPVDGRDGRTGELHTIYLAPEAWGRGIGRRLLRRAEDELRAAGYEDAILWVVEGNDRTRRFYELTGWTDDGGRKQECMPGIQAPAVRYRRRLD